MIKIKAIIFENIITFLNNILEPVVKKTHEKLLNLNYKNVINRLKKDEELKNLNSSLKDLASKEISPKYTTKKDQISIVKCKFWIIFY